MLMLIHLPAFGQVIAGYTQLFQGFCNNDNPGLIVFWLHARKPHRSLYLDCFSQKYLSPYSSVLHYVGKAWRSVAVELGKQIASKTEQTTTPSYLSNTIINSPTPVSKGYRGRIMRVARESTTFRA
jgi:hypothetical protein